MDISTPLKIVMPSKVTHCKNKFLLPLSSFTFGPQKRLFCLFQQMLRESVPFHPPFSLLSEKEEKLI